MRWSFKKSNLAWYEYGWAMLPIALAAVGGLIGGLCAVTAMTCNLYLMRSKLRADLKYGVAGLTTLAAVGVYFVIANVFNLHLGIAIITAESVDRDLQKVPVFVALKKADSTGYAALVDQLTDARKRAPADIQAATQRTLSTAVSANAPRASDQVVIDRARVLALEIDQIGAKDADACFYFLYPDLSHPIGWKDYITQEVAKFDEATTLAVLETGFVNPQPVPERPAVSEFLRQVGQRLMAKYGEDDIAMLNNQATADHAKLCSMSSAFYKEVLSLPRRQAVLLLRFLFAQQPLT